MADERILIGITQGDPNGIGWEVICKTLNDTRILEICTPVLYGSQKAAAFYKKELNLEHFNYTVIRNSTEAVGRKIYLIPVGPEDLNVECGKMTAAAGKSAVLALEAATKDLKEGRIHALVTAPFNKQNVQSDNYRFPGHTEYLAQHFGSENVLMLLTNETLRVGVVTGHIPLNEVSNNISKEIILNKLRTLEQALKSDFGIIKPKIAILGLNPHAGDGGLLGKEEETIIQPAVEEAIKNKILAFGPYPADGFFGSNTYKRFDGILAMYHDQGLAPFKALAFEDGVNYTAGLSIVRTSPAHGTGYDIAGRNEANPSSFRAALFMAVDGYRHRAGYTEMTKHPLPYKRIDPGNDNS